MVSYGVCTEDVDLGTIVSGSLEDDSRRLCSMRKRTKAEPLNGWGSEPGREGHCVHGWSWTETLVTPKRPQWMKQQPLQEEFSKWMALCSITDGEIRTPQRTQGHEPHRQQRTVVTL